MFIFFFKKNAAKMYRRIGIKVRGLTSWSRLSILLFIFIMPSSSFSKTLTTCSGSLTLHHQITPSVVVWLRLVMGNYFDSQWRVISNQRCHTFLVLAFQMWRLASCLGHVCVCICIAAHYKKAVICVYNKYVYLTIAKSVFKLFVHHL